MGYEKIKTHIIKHIDLYTVLLLFGCCVFLFFVNIGLYALMDVDETRYVAMAKEMFLTKDFLTLKLDEQFFFEKPPLYFWIECASFWIFGNINEITARLPMGMLGMLSTFMIYFVGKRLVSRNFGLIAALILATSLEFVVLAKLAILDIVVTAFIGFSVYCGLMTFFCNGAKSDGENGDLADWSGFREKNKKYFWWLFYVFSGLAVLAKGIPGFVIPFGIMFFASIFAKKFKEIFKPQYFIIGSLLFLLIVLPWHVIMLKMHGQMFWDEYVIKHHIDRFISSSEIKRAEPWYFYIITFLVGFIPWTGSALAVGIARFKSLFKFKWTPYNQMSIEQRFLWFNIIGFLFTFLFFSVSTTKLITYILPVYFFSACIFAYVWRDFMENAKYKKPINISAIIFSVIFIIAAAAAIFTPFFLSEQLYSDIEHTKWLCAIGLLVTGILGLWAVIKDKRILLFISYVVFIGYISAFLAEDFFEIDYKFGQDDLMKYAKFAKEQNHELTSFGFGNRYSLLYYYGTEIELSKGLDYEYLNTELLNKDTYVVVRNKDIENIAYHAVRFAVIKKGRKYSLIEGRTPHAH